MSIIDAIKKSVVESFDTSLSVSQILLSLGVALLASLFILLIYRMTMKNVTANRGFMITLLLVCSISAFIVLTITSNLALSLGMVGALSIVRFRTAIKDSSDTAFMFWSVAAGITAGAGFYLLTLIGCLFIGLVCILSVMIFSARAKPYLLVVRAAEVGSLDEVEKALAAGKVRYRLSSSVDNELYAEAIYELAVGKETEATIRSLKEIAGVKSVSLVDCQKN